MSGNPSDGRKAATGYSAAHTPQQAMQNLSMLQQNSIFCWFSRGYHLTPSLAVLLRSGDTHSIKTSTITSVNKLPHPQVQSNHEIFETLTHLQWVEERTLSNSTTKEKAKPSTLSCESSQLQQKEKQQSGKKKYFQWVTATRYLNDFTGEHCRSHYHLFTAIQHIPPFPSLVTSCSLATKPHFLSQTPDQLQLVFSSFLPEFLGHRQDHFEKENRIRDQNRRLKNYPQLFKKNLKKPWTTTKTKEYKFSPKKKRKAETKKGMSLHNICRTSNIPSAALGDQRLDSILNGECNHEHPCFPRLLLLLRQMLLLLTRHILLLRHHHSFAVIVAVVVLLSCDRHCPNPASSTATTTARASEQNTFCAEAKIRVTCSCKLGLQNSSDDDSASGIWI